MSYDDLVKERERLKALLKSCKNRKHTANYRNTEQMLNNIQQQITKLCKR